MSVHQINTDLLLVTKDNFDSLAIALLQYQMKHVEIYKNYVNMLGVNIDHVKELSQIPFLPIQFFKSQVVMSNEFTVAQKVFESSGTTGQVNSKHHVADLNLYEQSFMKAFETFFGNVSEYCILGLLPSYLERGQSSLVYMVSSLIKESKHTSSGFYLYNHDELARVLNELESKKQKTLLFGVTYALLDFAKQYPTKLNYVKIIETGGMKGRREELTRSEVHLELKNAFHLNEIYSEYGMTELLSQAYSLEQERFKTPAWMKVLVRDYHDPFEIKHKGRGAINIIDLANVHSCAFIATDDVGEIFDDSSFEIHGRKEQSDLRGCGLMLGNE